MEDWKARQKAYNHMTTNHRDDLTGIDVLNRPEFIVEDALMHFDKRVDKWIYPAKSFFVAICYANWIAEDFGEQFYDVLNYNELLPDDPPFLPYERSKEIYDEILSKVNFDNTNGMVPDVYEYYQEEFMIGQL